MEVGVVGCRRFVGDEICRGRRRTAGATVKMEANDGSTAHRQRRWSFTGGAPLTPSLPFPFSQSLREVQLDVGCGFGRASCGAFVAAEDLQSGAWQSQLPAHGDGSQCDFLCS